MGYSIIKYSVVWEDLDLLFNGLNITPDDNVLSISSAGDNVLGLLLKEPSSVTAIDMNVSQNFLLELKAAAIKELTYSEFLSIL
ncbi:S-adenosylmethionine:diacylglycerol 3-amino-3-carboxypropyl transferase, partial [Candidatus Magnetomorum sp. HK-1]